MKRLIRLTVALGISLAPFAAMAQIRLLPPCTENGNCGISDILAVFVNLAEFLLGIVGAVALGYFVYGGFVFIFSRGNKGEVDRAFGILKSATIGIFIIFLSGVFVRFTIQSLTGGNSAIPAVGETCKTNENLLNNGTSDPAGNGLWVLMPGGTGPDGKFRPEGLTCVAKETAATKAGAKCANLNGELKKRGYEIEYTCNDVGTIKESTCVRGLCSQLSAEYACCAVAK